MRQGGWSNCAASMGVRREGGKTGICSRLEIGFKKQTILENLKLPPPVSYVTGEKHD